MRPVLSYRFSLEGLFLVLQLQDLWETSWDDDGLSCQVQWFSVLEALSRQALRLFRTCTPDALSLALVLAFLS